MTEEIENQGLGIFTGLLLITIASLALYFLAIKTLSNIIESQTWAKEQCEITTSKLIVHQDSDGTSYKAEIKMKWTFEDGHHYGGSYNFGNYDASGYYSEQTIVGRHPVGSVHPCWVNPDRPWKAVLNRDIPVIVYIVTPIAIFFIVLGCLAIFGSLGILKGDWSIKVRHSD